MPFQSPKSPHCRRSAPSNEGTCSVACRCSWSWARARAFASVAKHRAKRKTNHGSLSSLLRHGRLPVSFPSKKPLPTTGGFGRTIGKTPRNKACPLLGRCGGRNSGTAFYRFLVIYDEIMRCVIHQSKQFVCLVDDGLALPPGEHGRPEGRYFDVLHRETPLARQSGRFR